MATIEISDKAAYLYAGDWRMNDEADLIQQYGMEKSEAEAICNELEEIAADYLRERLSLICDRAKEDETYTKEMYSPNCNSFNELLDVIRFERESDILNALNYAVANGNISQDKADELEAEYI